MKYMDYRDYIPSAKKISVWTMLIGLCAMSVLLFCVSCKSVQRAVEVHDTLIVVHHDTLVTEKVIKDSTAIKQFQSVIERLERDASDIRTIVLSEKGDTIKDYREKVIIKSESRDSVKWDSMIQVMESNLNQYKSRVDALYKALKEATEEKKEPSFFSKIGTYALAFILGLAAALIAVVIFIYKHK